MSVLALNDIHRSFEPGLPVLDGVDLAVDSGQIVGLLGPNGAGKTTCFYMIVGLIESDRGTITLNDQELAHLPMHQRAHLGLGYLPQEASVFRGLTVEENLIVGSLTNESKRRRYETMDWIYTRFPRLKERRTQKAKTLSGGEQQMLAIGRALMAKPKMIIMDEPSMGLSPKLVDDVFRIIQHVRQIGIPIFVVEQNLKKALSIADRGYILNRGQIVLQDSAENLLQNENVIKAYLGEE